MPKNLLVPVHLQALFLTERTSVRDSFADFTRLPYSDGHQDHNPDVAYLSEEIMTPPFQDENLVLPAGVHLHWYLPGVLTKTKSNGSTENTLPDVPDRWLVTRFRQQNIDKSWLVESDFLTGDALDNGLVRCHVPYYDGNPQSRNKPYRFLGRVTELDLNWKRSLPLTGERLEHLNAAGYGPQPGTTGYGEPTFAAFYPHCSSVFGFYDKEVTAFHPDDGLAYQVIGFYGRHDNDHLTRFITGFTSQPADPPFSAREFNERLYGAVNREFGWEFDFDSTPIPDVPMRSSFSLDDVSLPLHSFYVARIEFGAVTEATKPFYHIAVGNTGTEALSAFLAGQVDGDKALIENQLEAVQFTSKLNNRNLDLGAKFREARHEKGFAALPGETHWVVVLRSTGSQETGHGEDTASEAIVPAQDLHELNSLQLQYEKSRLDLETLQKHLFADWSKYMLCAYPPADSQDVYQDIDIARNFIEKNGIQPVLQQKQVTGELLVQENGQGELLQASARPDGADSIAARLARQMNKVLALVNTANSDTELIKTNKKYALKQVAGPRYWRPNDPVILLAQRGPSTEGIPDGGRDPWAVLNCIAIDPDPLMNLDDPDAPALLNLQKAVLPLFQNNQLQSARWSQNTWQPFLLEWEVEIFPAGTYSNLLTRDRSYTPDFITKHYQLDESETDFRPLETYNTTDEGETVYSGMSLLTPNASIKLGSDLKAWIAGWIKTDLPDRFFKGADLPPENRNYGYLEKNPGAFAIWVNGQIPGLTQLPWDQDENAGTGLDEWWKANLETLVTWYLALPKETFAGPVLNLMGGYRQLQSWQCLAQSLGGFNEALLMRKQTRQLEIADPIGFPEYQDFTGRVREAISGQSTTAPRPLNDFIPLRSGHMLIRGLRLVDNFGQTIDIDIPKEGVVTSEPLRDWVHHDKIEFRPRLSQPARMNLRWLSAKDPSKETIAHPDTGPVCGWLLPNYIDNSIAFYDGAGRPLGSLMPNPDAPWQTAPGSPSAASISHIKNIHLQRVAQYLYDQQIASLQNANAGRQTFLELFLSTMESALEGIDPENFARHPDMALLMGRPVAVVRVSLDLQLLGKPAIHQGWNVFIKQLQGAEPETDDFPLVEFPVRLGERRQLNDGLIGYWPETPEGEIGPAFYSPVAVAVDHPHIVTYTEGGAPLNISVNIEAPAQNFTLLMDPRGKLHATSGILPTKVIDIPAAQFTQALGNIAVTFQVAPLLSDKGKTKISLPAEPGFTWSWLERSGPAQWRELSRTALITKELLQEKIPDPSGLWESLTGIGWLRPLEDRPGTAAIIPKDQRKPGAQANFPQALLDNVDRVFDAYGIYLQPADTHLSFAAPQVIREGWLKISPEPVPVI